jgi:hypothetical protein
MTKENQAHFQLVLSLLEKAYAELKKSSMAFHELEKISFLTEIIKEQIRKESTGENENTHSAVR